MQRLADLNPTHLTEAITFAADKHLQQRRKDAKTLSQRAYRPSGSSGSCLSLELCARMGGNDARLVALHFPVAAPGGLLLAGVAGSCVSVLTKMPLLEVSLSGELESYERRILSRIGAGVLGSLIGCGLLGWGLISFSIHGQTFADVLNACSTSLPTSCTALQTLILLAVPMLFGFSERALTSFEQKVFGSSGQEQNTRIARREK
jgi:hypothetical protein